jgi:GNAT superfamily N-acetyltransferase
MSKRLRTLLVRYRTLEFRRFVVKLVRSAAATVDTTRTEGLRIQPITSAQAELLRQFNGRHRTKHDVAASTWYVKNRYQGFFAFLNDEPIGYWWWVSNKTDPALTHPDIDRFELRLRDDEVFAFDYFIAPEYRGHGAAVRVLPLIYGELTRLGYRSVWGMVDANNIPARWVYRVQGNKVVRRTISREVPSSLLVQRPRLFVRNTKWNSRHSLERRLLFSLTSKPVAGRVDGALARDGSADAV